MSANTHDDGSKVLTAQQVVDAFESETRTKTYNGGKYTWSDARSMRETHSLRPFWRALYETKQADRIDSDSHAVRFPTVIPNCLVHLRRDERELLKQEAPDLSGYPRDRRQVFRWLAADDQALPRMQIGGKDFLATGHPGSGKSTLNCDLARQIVEINPHEAAVWRGTPNRAEWTPLAPWTKLLLPAGVETTVTVEPPHHGAEKFHLDVEEVAREVVRYDDIFDLYTHFDPGKFHVVYPDPEFKGFDDLYYRSSRVPNFQHVSPWDAAHDPDTQPTPLNHFWFGYAIGLVDVMGPQFVSSFIDEIGDLLPQAARAGEKYHNWYSKIEAFRDALVDLRKNNKSLYMAGHNEADTHDMVRRKLRWRITMPGWPNPTDGDKVVGFGTAPMDRQVTQWWTVGTGLWWTATNWTKFTWKDVPKPVVAKVSVDYPGLAAVKA